MGEDFLIKKLSATQISVVQTLIMGTYIVGKSKTIWIFKLLKKIDYKNTIFNRSA